LDLGGNKCKSLPTPVHALRYIQHSSPVFSGLVTLDLHLSSADVFDQTALVAAAIDASAHSHGGANELRDLLAHLPKLENLYCEGVRTPNSTVLPPSGPTGAIQLPHLHTLRLCEVNMTGTGLGTALQALAPSLRLLSLRAISLLEGTWRSVFSIMADDLNLETVDLDILRTGQSGPHVDFVHIARERPSCVTREMKQRVLGLLREDNIDTTAWLARSEFFGMAAPPQFRFSELDDGFAVVIQTHPNERVLGLSLNLCKMDDVKFWMAMARDRHLLG